MFLIVIVSRPKNPEKLIHQFKLVNIKKNNPNYNLNKKFNENKIN